MIKSGIIGATGYAGQQLVWFLNSRPDVDIKFLCSHSYADLNYSDIYGNYSGIINEKCISMQEVENKLNEIDVLFTALPNGTTFKIVKKALEKGVKVIDFGADYRLKDPKTYEKWYKVKHEYPEILKEAVYGLPELNREKIKKARLIANPGCFPTASILAMSPLLKNKVIDNNSIIIDAKSGVSGAGRSAKTKNLFCECNESIKPYGVANHRHTPEIEQILSDVSGDDIKLTFTPHLVPMMRGILATCYATLKPGTSEKDIKDIYENFYKGEPFVKIIDSIPETRYVRGSNYCHISFRIDNRTGRIIVMSVIDNLIKGAAGQAVQNMNIIFGINEKTGLEFPAMIP